MELAPKAQVLECRGIYCRDILKSRVSEMAFPKVLKRYFPPRTPCCFVRIHARLGTMPSKCPRRIARFERFRDLNLLQYAFNVIQNWETMVRTGLEKSLKIEKLSDILEKSLDFSR